LGDLINDGLSPFGRTIWIGTIVWLFSPGVPHFYQPFSSSLSIRDFMQIKNGVCVARSQS
jgi:hypothetical protein